MNDLKEFNVAHKDIYQEWIRKMSGSNEIIVDISCSDNDHCAAWFSPEQSNEHRKVIYLNYPCMINPRTSNWLKIRVYLLHEAGHAATWRGWKHGCGGNEYLAHCWAMNKAAKLGHEKELSLLRRQAKSWGMNPNSLGNLNTPYRRAFKMMKKAQII
jgi:hypothetical protein